MAFEIKMNVTITQGGNPFFKSENEWDNLSYEQMNLMEKFFVGVLEELARKGQPGGEWHSPAKK